MNVVIRTAVFVCLAGVSFGSFAFAKDSCQEEGRVPAVCYKMKHLRAHVMVLDSQRDLLQLNYELLEATARSMNQAIARFMVSRNFGPHLQKLAEVRMLARRLEQEANAKDYVALRTANRIKSTCRSCHSSQEPPSGESWEEIFAQDWSAIVKRCNGETRNPYICKQMFGLASGLSYFHTAIPAGEMDFEMAAATSEEIGRIAEHLAELGGSVHEGGEDPLNMVKKWADDLNQYAVRRDPYVYQKSTEATDACQMCHGPRIE